jgi:phage baseplate assembly protein W
MYPEFGSDLGPILWEPHDRFLQQEIIKELQRALSLWEPRVRLEDIAFENSASLRNLGILVMSISFRLINNPRLTNVIQVPISSQGRLFSA